MIALYLNPDISEDSLTLELLLVVHRVTADHLNDIIWSGQQKAVPGYPQKTDHLAEETPTHTIQM